MAYPLQCAGTLCLSQSATLVVTFFSVAENRSQPSEALRLYFAALRTSSPSGLDWDLHCNL
jgi:hypothetical protein